MKNTNPNYLTGKINTLGDITKNIFYRSLDSYYHSNIKTDYADVTQHDNIKKIIINMIKQYNIVDDNYLDEISNLILAKLVQIDEEFNKLSLEDIINNNGNNKILYSTFEFIKTNFNESELLNILNEYTPPKPKISVAEDSIENILYNGYFNCAKAFGGIIDSGMNPGSNLDRKYRFNHTKNELQKELLFTIIFQVDITNGRKLLKYIKENRLYRRFNYNSINNNDVIMLFYKVRELSNLPEYRTGINNFINELITKYKGNNSNV